MIVTKTGTIETYAALTTIVDVLDQRFPDGNNIFQRVSRLCEETGELASAVNHREKMGIKRDKYGAPDDEHLVKEVQDVMHACLGIAKHYHLEGTLEKSIQDFYTDYEEKGHLSY
jgi:NTP pyrophosphatase (non-canonical NTP hydrolase)